MRRVVRERAGAPVASVIEARFPAPSYARRHVRPSGRRERRDAADAIALQRHRLPRGIGHRGQGHELVHVRVGAP